MLAEAPSALNQDARYLEYTGISCHKEDIKPLSTCMPCVTRHDFGVELAGGGDTAVLPLYRNMALTPPPPPANVHLFNFSWDISRLLIDNLALLCWQASV